MKARTSAGVSAASSLSEGAPPRCSAKKAQKLQHVAAIRFERLRRHPPLGAEVHEPAFDLRRYFWATDHGLSLVPAEAGTQLLAPRLPVNSRFRGNERELSIAPP